MKTGKPLRVLFVCLGNICRSPLAEAVVKHEAEQQQLQHRFHLESAGTGDWHIGKGADKRSIATALSYGLDLSGHRAQQITRYKVAQWDVFVVMDTQNKHDLLAMGIPASRIVMMRAFEGGSSSAADVPDPYYGGDDGFEVVYRMLVYNTQGLLQFLAEYQGQHP